MVKRLSSADRTSACGGGMVGYRYFGAYRGFREPVFVDIGHGMSSRDIAAELARQGVVRADWIFLAVRALHPRAKLQAGEYRFAEPQTPWQVFEKIRRGEIFYQDFTVPEGSNIFDIASLADSLGGVKADDFLRAAADPAAIRDLDPGRAESRRISVSFDLSGDAPHHRRAALPHDDGRVSQAMAHALAGADVHRTTTLASLVEKETGSAARAGTGRERLRKSAGAQHAAAMRSQHGLRGAARKSLSRHYLQIGSGQPESVQHLYARRIAAWTDCESGSRVAHRRASSGGDRLSVFRGAAERARKPPFFRHPGGARKSSGNLPVRAR